MKLVKDMKDVKRADLASRLRRHDLVSAGD